MRPIATRLSFQVRLTGEDARSSDQSEEIFETLDALRVQSGSPPYEVIIADRRSDAVTEVIRSQHPEYAFFPAQSELLCPNCELSLLRVLAANLS